MSGSNGIDAGQIARMPENVIVAQEAMGRELKGDTSTCLPWADRYTPTSSCNESVTALRDEPEACGHKAPRNRPRPDLLTR